MLGLAQDAHNALAQLVQHVMGVAAVLLATRGIVTGTAGEFAYQLFQRDVGVLH
ncbi:hypothetical protein D9M70_601190 [compost metagenome]